MDKIEKQIMRTFEPERFHVCKNKTKGLPDWFDYDYYTKDLFNETDVNRWAFEFAIRQRDTSKNNFLKEFVGSYSYGYADNKLMGELHWKNGLYVGRSGKYSIHIGNSSDSNNHPCHSFGSVGIMDSMFIIFLNNLGGKFIPDDEINKNQELIKDLPIKTQHRNPKLFEYSRRTGKYGHTYFPTQKAADKYKEHFEELYNKTATFYVNLKMPTNRLIQELENRIKELKKVNKIRDIKIPNNKVFKTWAIGLGCYDLHNYGDLEPNAIKRKFLSLVFDGNQKSMSQPITNKDNDRYFDKLKPVNEMIKNGWKKLSGNPF